MKYDDSEKIAKIIKNFERIIVTGCAGFIGWKVSEMLLDLGKEVIGIDNLNDAYDVRLK